MFLWSITLAIALSNHCDSNWFNRQIAQKWVDGINQKKRLHQLKAVKIGMSFKDVEAILGPADASFGFGPGGLMMFYDGFEVGLMYQEVAWIRVK